MKISIKKWHSYIQNTLDDNKTTLKTRQELINYIKNNPEVNKTINLDNPKGSTKKFTGKISKILPFDYGEWPNLINPSDNMGWDLIFMPNSSKKDENLTPVGHIEYNKEKKSKFGNDKVILASNFSYSDENKKIIDDFFAKLPQFDDVTWY